VLLLPPAATRCNGAVPCAPPAVADVTWGREQPGKKRSVCAQ
jgi:hypothetical protein